MDKYNNKSAARARRSAVAERIRLREEWTALKRLSNAPGPSTTRQTIQPLNKKPHNIHKNMGTAKVTSDVLRGVVALVEVGAESRALALRAALTALGATVMPSWTPLVTHLIWSEGGSRATRAKARALASRLVSPLWVEACAASARRLPERTFPAAARDSDLPSPRTLKRLLKKAEVDQIPLEDLFRDNKNEDKAKSSRLRISSETEQDTSTDKTPDTSHDTSNNTTADVESRVNTAPRRALPMSITPPLPKKSRRKLFTQREAEEEGTDADSDSEAEKASRSISIKMTQREQKELARAERMARRLVAACTSVRKPRPIRLPHARMLRIVITGMSKSERKLVYNAVKELNGRVQKRITKKTTHVLIGSCREDPDGAIENISGVSCITNPSNISKKVIPCNDIEKPRTLNTLIGAVRGCRVLYGQWALDSLEAKHWLHHHGYEVQHLKKVSQKARVERKSLGLMRSEYAYDVFNGMRIRLSSKVEQKDAVIQLLSLCGAIILNENGGVIHNGALTQNCVLSQSAVFMQNGGSSVQIASNTQYGGQLTNEYDMILGTGDGEVNSKWVFDSVAASRMKTTRRYINYVTVNTVTQSTKR